MLHRLLRDEPVEHFVLFASVASLLTTAGQAEDGSRADHCRRCHRHQPRPQPRHPAHHHRGRTHRPR
ncbi:KR domain-containing protein [Streptomyces olivaceus]